MITAQHKVLFAVGLHARPAGKFVKLAKSFESSITLRNITRDGEQVDAKSLVKVMKIACAKDHEVELTFDGPDEQAAADALGEFLAQSEE
jgi:phosphotransferase system HPr (HPr) family protein